EVIFAVGSYGRALKTFEEVIQRFVEIIVVTSPGTHIGEQTAEQKVKALLCCGLVPAELDLIIGDLDNVKTLVARFALGLIQIRGQVFGNESIEQHPQHIGFEVPTVDAATQVVGDAPNGLMQFGSFQAVTVHAIRFTHAPSIASRTDIAARRSYVRSRLRLPDRKVSFPHSRDAPILG